MITQEIAALLDKKLELFLEFENYTLLLGSCDIDTMSNYITKCSKLANQIENVTEQIIALCDSTDLVPPAKDILSNRCDYAAVPFEWQPLFLQSQNVIGVVSRTLEANSHTVKRMCDIQSLLKNRIAETKNTSRIIKYISSSGVVQQERGISLRNQKI